MGADQSKDSPPNRAAAVSGSDFHYESREEFQHDDGTENSGLQPTQDQQYSWNTTVDTSSNGISNATQSVSAEAVSVYGDIPFTLSPAFYARINYLQLCRQSYGFDVNFANLSKYDYDFRLERSVVGH